MEGVKLVIDEKIELGCRDVFNLTAFFTIFALTRFRRREKVENFPIELISLNRKFSVDSLI